MKKLIESNLSGKKVLLLFLLTNLVYTFMLLVTIPKVMEFSNGIELLDMMPFGYDADYVHTLLATLGHQGRSFYLYMQIPIDLVYPSLFGISYCLILAYYLKRLNKLNSILIYLCWVPIIAGVFDYLENFGIISMLNGYPNFSKNLIMSANIFTIVKSMFTTIYFVVLLVVLILVGLKSLKQKTGIKAT